MKRLFGNSGGLKANQIRRLENLYRRRLAPQYVVSPEIARDISLLSHELRRQIGLLIDRSGRIRFVVVGDHQGIVIPALDAYRVAPGRLRGLRLIHTHLHQEPLTADDIADLALLRLDLIAAVVVDRNGEPHRCHVGHILPHNTDGQSHQLLDPLRPNQLDIGCLDLIQAIETELSRSSPLVTAGCDRERALLVSVSTASRSAAQRSLNELAQLADSGGLDVIGSVVQHRKQPDARFLMGRGKLRDLIVTALQRSASLILFDQELNPSQIRSIADQIDFKVVDRTQLILDIFAQRAQTKEGKLQVELAQLKYLLPRLVTKNTAMSRLTGGIGGRGPGETKLEINRRRVRDRIAGLEKALGQVIRQRQQQKSRRQKRGLPVISIIGYTNAGKSTLLNTLTHSRVLAESRLFATLDPTSRRLRFPRDTEVIITDTVGFIKDLPKELMAAFRATLEELQSADLLLHVIDISNPGFRGQIDSVEKILADLGLQRMPILRVLNKEDRLPPEKLQSIRNSQNGICVSAKSPRSLVPLIERMEEMIVQMGLYNPPETGPGESPA